MATKKNIAWDKQPLGKVTDSVLADKLGVCRESVWCARTKRGIPAFKDPHSNTSKKDIVWDEQLLLGKVPDRVIAEKLGVSVTTVCLARTRRGIPAFKDPRSNTSKKNIVWDKQPLGRVSDRVIADKLGVSVSSVCLARTRRGIPAFKK
jgi:Trp operon repressor